MNNYEVTVILRTSDTESLKDTVKKILQKHNVEITLEDPWGVKKLAYQIDNESEGYYYFMNVESPADSIQKIINDFKLNRDILRYLFVKIQVKKSA